MSIESVFLSGDIVSLRFPAPEGVSRMSAAHSVTQLLERWNNGELEALDELMPLIYDELRKMAKRYMSHQNPGHTLQTTALIHEAYLRMVKQKEKHFENRSHFF